MGDAAILGAVGKDDPVAPEVQGTSTKLTSDGPGHPDDGFTDAELTALALAADPDEPLDPEAIPLSEYLGQEPGLLPQWYMPMAMARCGANRWRAPVVLGIVLAFVVLEALGLCSAFGQVVVG